ncbi:hypothetical protein ACH5RR_015806 [Cinchona calisaya]|uniref:Amino acid transporter transmembrane domain-containing protein n=1 Tax=Cinchona calisaya TaxID=153742 RepID=A0ABD2ZU70_9GENT
MKLWGILQVDPRTAEEKAIDDWLPITSSRNAKWWYSAFHNVTAMVGAGVLSLPYAMSELGWRLRRGSWDLSCEISLDTESFETEANFLDSKILSFHAPRVMIVRVLVWSLPT